ncbi:MAG: peptidase M3, partial [Pseudomonadota bacterium]
MTNPLMTAWTGPFGLPPFEQIEDAHFEPAFEAGLAAARADIAAIADNPEPATLANTIEALELAGEDLSRVVRVFFHLVEVDASPERQRMQGVFVKALSAYNSEDITNPKLFA